MRALEREAIVKVKEGGPTRTSEHLTIGSVYSRDDLSRMFEIKDATLMTGIFRPRNHDSIWLFVTREKTPDRVQYKDELRGDELVFDGQLQGAKDRLLIEHVASGLEVLLFYRARKYEHSNAGFRYEGRFEYVGHYGSGPTQFRFHRLPGQAA
jgi:putative restriction endonuclease